MTRIHVQRWDWSPFHDLIAAWTRYRPKGEKLHMHHCLGCQRDVRCYKLSCRIILPGGRYSLPFGNPEKCRKCL